MCINKSISLKFTKTKSFNIGQFEEMYDFNDFIKMQKWTTSTNKEDEITQNKNTKLKNTYIWKSRHKCVKIEL
jgi:hypothetical protein